MEENGKHAGAVEKAFMLLALIIRDAGISTLTMIAEQADMPLATAHRIAKGFVRSGHLIMGKRGHYYAGPALLGLGRNVSMSKSIAGLSRLPLANLAKRFGSTAHFGIFEQDMVTYLVREGGKDSALHTAEDTQLEAYCSALGKILLSRLPEREIENYLANGPFIALTQYTLVDADDIRAELLHVRECGYAMDNREIDERLLCVAVPVALADGATIGALSLSARDRDLSPAAIAKRVGALHETAEKIARQWKAASVADD